VQRISGWTGLKCNVSCPFTLQFLDNWLLEDADGFGSAKQAVHGSSQLALVIPGLTIPWAHAGYLWRSACQPTCTCADHQCYNPENLHFKQHSAHA
jgi:hypothetical protein